MRVSFDLSDRDLAYFRRIMVQARESAKSKPEPEIKRGAQDLLDQLRDAEVSDFIRERLLTLQTMLEILEDAEWRLEGEDRSRVVDALAYFAEPEDLIPDRIPGLGFLDDAIMIELVAQELRHDLEAYRDFCDFRSQEEERRGRNEDAAAREEWLRGRRQQLHARMRRRRRTRRRRSARPSGPRAPLGLW